ncbi:MAG: hypothetical protein ABIR32_09325 [Ilumatobacteraceae bacterium]
MNQMPGPALWMAQSMATWRTLLARRPWISWLFIVGIAGLIAVAVSNALSDVRRERDRWGETTTVHVAIAAIAPGDLIAPLVESRTVPIAMAPASAQVTVDGGTTARQRVAVGEIVVEVDVGPATGPLALLPAGWLAITVEDTMSTSFTIGDHAAVLAAGSNIADDALVIDVLPDAVVIGVPADNAPAVAEMVAQRLAVIALSGG